MNGSQGSSIFGPTAVQLKMIQLILIFSENDTYTCHRIHHPAHITRMQAIESFEEFLTRYLDSARKNLMILIAWIRVFNYYSCYRVSTPNFWRMTPRKQPWKKTVSSFAPVKLNSTLQWMSEKTSVRMPELFACLETVDTPSPPRPWKLRKFSGQTRRFPRLFGPIQSTIRIFVQGDFRQTENNHQNVCHELQS